MLETDPIPAAGNAREPTGRADDAAPAGRRVPAAESDTDSGPVAEPAAAGPVAASAAAGPVAEPGPLTPPGARVSIEHLVKRYRSGESTITAVNDVSLTVEPGRLVAVTGASGSGKSTLLHLVGAMDRADDGRILVDDTDITTLRRGRLTQYRRRIGFVFQRFHLLPVLTALDNVLAPVLPYRVDFDRRARARELLAAVGLADRERALPSQLSGGQQQRVAIARALISRPTLLLADEPTGNLDSQTGSEIFGLLLDLRERYGMTVLVATHEREIAARCQRLIRLQDGRVTDDHDFTAGDISEGALERINGLRT